MEWEAAEIRRYARHLSLPEMGEKGQSRLKAARVLIVGMGGLGCPAALYLAGAGIGTLGLVDPDRVDISNLQRQTIYRTKEIGLMKAEVAAHHLKELNPHVSVYPFPLALDAGNATNLISGYDLVVDATDNFATRYLINDACYFLGKRSVFASVTRFEGRLSIFGGASGPCYRCLFPAPPSDIILNCAQEGILGPVPGVFGALQALETIKIISGIGTPLQGSLLLFDFLTMESRRIAIPRNPECPLCGPRATIKALESTHPVCARAPEISAADLISRLSGPHDIQLIDVREPEEYREGTLPAAISIPLDAILRKEVALPLNKTLVLFCRSGQRSQLAAQSLIQRGVSPVLSLAGGFLAWP